MPMSPDEFPTLQALGPRQGFLQVLLPEFTLVKHGAGVTLEVAVTDDVRVFPDAVAQRRFLRTYADAEGTTRRQRFREQLARFHEDEQVRAQRFDCADCRFRYANGGVLPVVCLDGTDYFCLFYRDVYPTGWNIANGASDDLEDLLVPERILLREFAEEWFVADPASGRVLVFDAVGDAGHGTQQEGLAAWAERGALAGCVRHPLSVRWQGGPDRVRATVRGRTLESGDYFLSLTPEDNSIELDRVARIELSGPVGFLDGEFAHGRLINRLVGLFPVGDLHMLRARHGRLPEGEFWPACVYRDGVRHACPEPAALAALVRQRRVQVPAGIQYEAVDDVFRLCPVTRNLLERYLALVDSFASLS